MKLTFDTIENLSMECAKWPDFIHVFARAIEALVAQQYEARIAELDEGLNQVALALQYERETRIALQSQAPSPELTHENGLPFSAIEKRESVQSPAQVAQTEGHNFGNPLGYAVVLISDNPKQNGMLNGGAHTFKKEALEVCNSKEYAGRHRVIELWPKAQQPAPLAAQVRNDWKEVMLDECVITHTEFCEDDPRKTLLSLIHWHIGVALDPAVSQAARQVRNDALEEAAKLCDAAHESISDPIIIGREAADAGHNVLDNIAERIRRLQSQPSEVKK